MQDLCLPRVALTIYIFSKHDLTTCFPPLLPHKNADLIIKVTLHTRLICLLLAMTDARKVLHAGIDKSQRRGEGGRAEAPS